MEEKSKKNIADPKLQSPKALEEFKETIKSQVLNETRIENRKLFLQVTSGLILGLGLGITISFYWETLANLSYLLIGTLVVIIIIISALLYYFLAFKNNLLTKVFGIAKASQEDIFNTIVTPVKGIIRENVSSKHYEHKIAPYLESIEKGGRQVIAYLAYRHTRRMLFSFFISLMIGLGGIVGTILLLRQNELLYSQNTLITTQNQLIEGQRRSSLIFMMSNIMDKVDEEIKVKKEQFRKYLYKVKRIESLQESQEQFDSMQAIEQELDTLEYTLSISLIGRIVALSHAFKPHQYLDRDTLSKSTSPERGQLLMALTKVQLDSITYNRIYSSANFIEADLTNANLRDANLRGANLRNAYLREANLRGASLRGAELQYVDLEDANLRGANLDEADLTGANLRSANLVRANFQGASLVGTELSDADIREGNLRGVQMYWTNFKGAYLAYADFTNAYSIPRMNASIVWLDIEGEKVLNGRVDLRGANLRGAKLSRVEMYGTDFRNVNLIEANLEKADFSMSNFLGANLEKANLNEVNLSEANLSNVNFDQTNLERTNLLEANIFKAKNLTLDQLLATKSLFKTKGIPDSLLQKIRQQKPELLESPKEN